MFTDTFAGIAPASVPGFVAMQLLGAAVATGVVLVLYPDVGALAAEVVSRTRPPRPPITRTCSDRPCGAVMFSLLSCHRELNH
jgi:arsenate reductase